jgi:large subunit ribosomal protein L24
MKDEVMVLVGKDKGKKGEVIGVFKNKNKIVVSNINFIKRHIKPTREYSGGIKEIEAPISVSNVMLICKKCDRVFRPKFDKLYNGKKIRLCRKCGEIVM